MPGYTDHHRDTKVTVNPYEEQPTKVSEYTAHEIATLQSRLDKQLGPEYISTRPGAGGGKVHYVTAEKVINLANQVFGFNGWSSSIQNVQVDFVDESSGGKIALGLSIIVRVTLRDGTYHEDIGYGQIENCKSKAAAFEKAKKEGTTDALKRALRNFGNVLGNCLYDKDYLQKVAKIKVAPSKWDADNLHRHPDYAPIKKEPVVGSSDLTKTATSGPSAPSAPSNESIEDEFGVDDFDETDFAHPEEVGLEDTIMNGTSDVPQAKLPPNRAATRSTSTSNIGRTGSSAPRAPPNQQTNNRTADAAVAAQRQQQRPAQPPQNDDLSANVGDALPPGAPVGFVTGKMAGSQAPQPFNPHADSPSIRRTAGVNSGKSEPILRKALNASGVSAGPVTANGQQTPAHNGPTNFVNPSADAHRKIGMPGGGMASPLSNRGQYKPPTTLKRPPPGEVAGGRPPLADMSNVGGLDNGVDPKKVKVEGGVRDGVQNQAPPA